jgi:HEAT repeat protein
MKTTAIMILAITIAVSGVAAEKTQVDEQVYARLITKVLANQSGAMRALAEMGAPVVPQLLQTFHDCDDESRARIAWVFSRMGATASKAVTTLLEHLNEEHNDWSTYSILRATAKIVGPDGNRPDAVKAAHRLKNSKSELIAGAAAGALAEMAPDQVDASAVVGMLRVETLRYWAKPLIEELGDKAVPALISLFKDAKLPVRRQASELLSAIGPSEASAHTALLPMLKDEDLYTRRQLALALGLGKYQGTEHLPILLEGLKSNLRSDIYMRYREAIRLTGKPAMPIVLKEVLELSKRRNVRERHDIRGLLWEMKTIGPDDPAMVAPLVKLLNRRDFGSVEQYAIIDILGALGKKGAAAVPKLSEIVMDGLSKHRRLHKPAVNALVRIGTKEAIAALQTAHDAATGSAKKVLYGKLRDAGYSD